LGKVYRYCGGVDVRRRNGTFAVLWRLGDRGVGDVQVETGGTVGAE
jgi:hypothetical protein